MKISRRSLLGSLFMLPVAARIFSLKAGRQSGNAHCYHRDELQGCVGTSYAMPPFRFHPPGSPLHTQYLADMNRLDLLWGHGPPPELVVLDVTIES